MGSLCKNAFRLLLVSAVCLALGCSDEGAGPGNAGPPSTGAHVWSKSFGDIGEQRVSAVAVDEARNVFLAGHFQRAVDFGGGKLTSTGAEDIFIAKFGPDGSHLWSKRFGDAFGQGALAVAVDALGNVTVTGYFGGTVDFGGGELRSAGWDIFLAQFGSDGAHLWSKRFGGAVGPRAYQAACAVAIDPDRNVILAGYYEGALDFGGGTLTSRGFSDIFIAKLTSDGAHLWSRSFGEAGDQVASALAVDESGDIILTGYFRWALDFGGGALTGAGEEDVFVAKLDPAGAHLWSRSFGDASGQYGTAVAVDESGDVIIAGSFLGAVDLGGGALTSMGSSDIFLAKLRSNGVHAWSKAFGDEAEQQATSVAADAWGRTIAAGYFQGAVPFGGGTRESAGAEDVFVAKFGPVGLHLWSRPFGDVSEQRVAAIAADVEGNVIVAGNFYGTVDFGGGTLASAGAEDIFIAKFGP